MLSQPGADHALFLSGPSISFSEAYLHPCMCACARACVHAGVRAHCMACIVRGVIEVAEDRRRVFGVDGPPCLIIQSFPPAALPLWLLGLLVLGLLCFHVQPLVVGPQAILEVPVHFFVRSQNKLGLCNSLSIWQQLAVFGPLQRRVCRGTNLQQPSPMRVCCPKAVAQSPGLGIMARL